MGGMDTVLFLRQASDFQSMEMERVQVICGLETSPQSRLWPTRGGYACKQEVAFFGLRLAGTKMACLNQFSAMFSWSHICWHREDHESNPCVVLAAEFQSAARNPVGRTHVRHDGHYRRSRRLRLFRASADAPAARDRRRRTGVAVLPRRPSNGVARSFLSFFHRVFCRHCLPYGEPLDPFPSGARRNLWCFIWRRCLLLHESHRGAAVGCHKISVFLADDGHWRSHPHLLCRAAHRPRGTTIINAVKTSWSA